MSTKLDIFTSTTADGNMKSLDQNYASVLPTRAAWLSTNNIAPVDTTLVQLSYNTNDFCKYYTLNDDNKGDGITRPASYIADALVVIKPGHALFLPLADCVGAVIHDTRQNIMMLSHLGRHNLEQYGGTKSIEYLVQNHGSKPSELTAWLSPAAGSDNYPLYAFDHRSLHDVAHEQLTAGGLQPQNITASDADSTKHPDYFSHSEHLRGNQESDGRHAVVAVLR